MHSVVKVIIKYYIEEGCCKEYKSNWNIEYICIICEKVEEKHIKSNFVIKQLNSETSLETVYNNMFNKNSFQTL